MTAKLTRWLKDHGHIDDDQAGDAVERARGAARDLPAADRLGRLLHDVAARAADRSRRHQGCRLGRGSAGDQ
jgi:hypothetical protein